METSILVINEEPYCLWENDVRERNVQFLSGVDPDYFDYLLNTYGETEDEKRGSVALRIALHHALETLFALLGAYIQAPDCTYAWIAKYSNGDLRTLLGRIARGDPNIFTKLAVPTITWTTVSESVFRTFMPGTSRQASTIERFSWLWEALASELTGQSHIDEYNALKHGFRVKSGGFALAFGRQSSPGQQAPADQMHLLGKSDFGATFYKIESLWPDQKNRSIRSRRNSIN